MIKVFAQATSCDTFKFGGCKDVASLINAGINTFFAVIWIVAIIYLAYGGIMFITSAGDKAKADTAQKALTNALIGIVVILGINVIITLVGSLLTGGTSVVKPSVGISIPVLSQ